MGPLSVQRENDGEDEETEERRRKAILLFVVLFLLVGTVGAYWLAGSPTEPVPGDLYEATGDLTVTVENQRDEPVAGREVSLVHPETGKVVASGTTASNGTVTFRNVEQGRYKVRVDGKSHSVSLTDEEESLTVGVTVSPPKSYRSLAGYTVHVASSTAGWSVMLS